MNSIAILLASILLFCPSILGKDPKGVVSLDEFSFEKILNKFPKVLVKFDEKYPYGDKQDAFADFTEDMKENDEILIAEVGITDYGENENKRLGDNYGAKKEDFPVYKLFTNGDLANPKSLATGDRTSADLKKFIASNSDIYIGLAGCLKQYDIFAAQFFDSVHDRKAILASAEQAKDALPEGRQRKSAEFYIKVMGKIIKDGDEFVTKETDRLEKLKGKKISADKVKEFDERLNILSNFKGKKGADEL